MMNRTISLVLLNLVLMAGCDDVHPPRAIPADKVPPGAYPRNVAVEPFLENELVVGPSIVTDGTADRPMMVKQPMRNVREWPLEIQYQFVFLDKTGSPLPGSGWRNLTLESRIERFLEGAALDTNAVDWRLNVRAAK
jgi:hypothetical protein